MTWLDLGNGWRNLFLLSCMLQAFAWGTLFCVRKWFYAGSRTACFLTGVSVTPLVQYLWTLLLAFIWPHAPKAVYIGALPCAAILSLGYTCIRNGSRLRSLPAAISEYIKNALHLNKPAVAALCFVICLMLLIGPACIRFMSSTNSVNAGQDTGEYMGMALRFCEERNIGTLLDKNDQTGRIRGNSHFPSLELYMSYGLFHTGGTVGYPFDKAAFTGLGLLIFFVLAAYTALLLNVCRGRKIIVLFGLLLFNLIPNLYDSVSGAPRDIWRILGLMVAMVMLFGIREEGSWKHYLLKLLLMFVLCFTVMSTHVLCFVTLPFLVAAWAVWRCMRAMAHSKKGWLSTLVRTAGMGISGAAGVLLAYSGNLWCWFKWKEMSPWRLMTTYTTAPWYDAYMQMDYRIEETTTHLNFSQVKQSVLLDYKTPTGIWALAIALLIMIIGVLWVIWYRTKLRRDSRQTVFELNGKDGEIHVQLVNRSADDSPLLYPLFMALLTFLSFAPMSGLLDNSYYCFSGTFVKLPRYTIQWFFWANAMICAALTLLWNIWPAILEKLKTFRKSVLGKKADPYFSRIPEYLCLLLCVLSMVKGLNQTGYTDTFYRYSRGVMENEQILLDTGFQDSFGLLMDMASHVGEDQKILITRDGYQYPLRGRGYILTSNPIVPLMAIETKAGVQQALSDMNAVMLATDPSFWDERYFSRSVLSDYLNDLPPEQIVQTPKMRLYLIDPSLVSYVPAQLTATQEVSNAL